MAAAPIRSATETELPGTWRVQMAPDPSVFGSIGQPLALVGGVRGPSAAARADADADADAGEGSASVARPAAVVRPTPVRSTERRGGCGDETDPVLNLAAAYRTATFVVQNENGIPARLRPYTAEVRRHLMRYAPQKKACLPYRTTESSYPAPCP
ncbi:hypothetical protein ABZ725_44660 [Streptomyces sp. NPDC006872]|uniref:hypothetical protein n=1 Tax=Streptomyces sp. NPDC006872 TaxID=3155720 RepID=UPI0033F7D016